MDADTLTAPSSFLSLWRVDRRWADRGTGCSTGSWASGKHICSSGVLRRSWFSAGGRVHACILVWAVVRSAPPLPESGSRSVLLIRSVDLHPGPVDVSRPESFCGQAWWNHRVVTTSLLHRPSGQHVRTFYVQRRASTYPVAVIATGEVQCRSPVHAGCRQTGLWRLCQCSGKQVSDRKLDGAVKVSASMINVIQEPVDIPVPTGFAGATISTRNTSPLVRQMTLDDDLSVDEEVVGLT